MCVCVISFLGVMFRSLMNLTFLARIKHEHSGMVLPLMLTDDGFEISVYVCIYLFTYFLISLDPFCACTVFLFAI